MDSGALKGDPGFQSTRPARGATKKSESKEEQNEISIHAPREGRDCKVSSVGVKCSISIHAPREGRDMR